MSLRKPVAAPLQRYRGPGAASKNDTDPYAVLSMHQPWASLLIWGIKHIEGRSWPTEHRGRLWIHATSQKPSDAEIQELEQFYSEVHALDGRLPIFPLAYPTSALLGCINVVDCLSAEDVLEWEGLPAGVKKQALSPYAWLCEAPRRLVVPQQMRGFNKIWTLPKAKLDPLERALKDPPALMHFSWADQPARSAPSEQVQQQKKPSQQQQQQQQQALPASLPTEMSPRQRREQPDSGGDSAADSAAAADAQAAALSGGSGGGGAHCGVSSSSGAQSRKSWAAIAAGA